MRSPTVFSRFSNPSPTCLQRCLQRCPQRFLQRLLQRFPIVSPSFLYRFSIFLCRFSKVSPTREAAGEETVRINSNQKHPKPHSKPPISHISQLAPACLSVQERCHVNRSRQNQSRWIRTEVGSRSQRVESLVTRLGEHSSQNTVRKEDCNTDSKSVTNSLERPNAIKLFTTQRSKSEFVKFILDNPADVKTARRDTEQD